MHQNHHNNKHHSHHHQHHHQNNKTNQLVNGGGGVGASSNAMTDLSNISTSAAAVSVAATPTTPSSRAFYNEEGCADCVFSDSDGYNETNQNGVAKSQPSHDPPLTDDASPRRHSSMDQLMGLLNDMGKSVRTRSLSDGGGPDEGKNYIQSYFLLILPRFLS